MRWHEYRACCQGVASDVEVAFCPECSHPLFRCAQCRNLVNPRGFCDVCVRLELYLAKDAVRAARVGDCLTVPFILKNTSAVSRTLWVQHVLKDGKHVKGEPVPLKWQQLETGRDRAFSVDTEPFATGGVTSLRLTIIVASRFEEIEELYAFSGEVDIEVKGNHGQAANKVNVSGDVDGPVSITVYESNLAVDHKTTAGSQTIQQPVKLERADLHEIQSGIRGYATLGARVGRDVEFVFDGFPAGDTPANGPLRGLQPVLRCGRNSRNFDSERNPKPNDLCLRIHDAGSGELDPEASKAISRHLCDFTLQNDRLYVRPLSENGLVHNGEILKPGALAVVMDGDSFATPANARKTVTFEVKFRTAAGLVTQIRFVRREAKDLAKHGRANASSRV
jgi:hypothetical protein